jgi:hypothetical protein
MIYKGLEGEGGLPPTSPHPLPPGPVEVKISPTGWGEIAYWARWNHLLGEVKSPTGWNEITYWVKRNHLLGEVKSPTGWGEITYWLKRNHLLGEMKSPTGWNEITYWLIWYLLLVKMHSPSRWNGRGRGLSKNWPVSGELVEVISFLLTDGIRGDKL